MKKIWLILVTVLLMPSAAWADELPFIFPPHPDYEVIPDNRGMEFFYGLWDNLRMNEGYGHWRITPYRLILENSRHIDEPYRVLVEAPNYVLILSLFTTNLGKTWTDFKIYNYSPMSPTSSGITPAYPFMQQHYCSSFMGSDGPGAFYWSKEKLIETFKNSQCGKNIGTEIGFHGYFKGFWSTTNYIYHKSNPPKVP